MIKSAVGVGTLALATPAVWRRAHGAQSLVVADPGGPYTKAFTEAFYKPFTKDTGIEIVGVARAGNPSSQVKALVETKNYTWDVVTLSQPIQELLRSQDMLEKIDTSGPEMAEIPASMRTDHWMGTNVYCFVTAYRTDKYGNNPPQNFGDVWDIRKFPGKRSLRNYAPDSIEVALRADGVPGGEEIYKVLSTPAGWDRAFKKLDEIKRDVAVWWTGSAQSTQMIKAGEVDICTMFNARAQAAIDAGGPVGIAWDGGFYGLDGWSIPKGNPKADLGRQFIKYCADAKRQAVTTEHMAYGPSNLSAYRYIDAKRAALLPTSPDNLKKTAPLNDQFWGQHKDAATERFNAWLLK